MALLAGRTVGDIAHGIDRFVRRPGGYDHALAGKRRADAQQALDRSDNLKRFGHPAQARFATLGHFAGIRSDNVDAIGSQLRQITNCRLGGPHMRVHRRCNQDRLVGRQQNSSGKIVGMAARHFCQQVCRRRGNHDQVRLAG